MRRNKLSFIILFGLVFGDFLASCESEEDIPEGYKPSTTLFKVSSDAIDLDGLASDGSSIVTGTFKVNSSTSWFLETDAWGDLTVTANHDNGNVTIRTSENQTPKRREGKLTITTTDGLKKTLPVLQRPGKIELYITPADVKIGSNGGSTNITINCNTSWTLTGGADWCSANVAEGVADSTIIVTIKGDAWTAPTANETRTASFTVKPLDGTPAAITVTQMSTAKENIVLSVSQQEMITFNTSAGQTKEFFVTCNEEWEAYVNADWLEVTPEKSGASQSTAVTVKCTKGNFTGADRFATITVQSYDKKEVINVRQRSTDIYFNVTLREMTTDGSEQTLLVLSNTSWRVFCNQGWCHLASEGQGQNGLYTGDGFILLTFDANTTGQSRTAYITFEPIDYDPVTITVTQRAGSSSSGRQPGEDDNGRPNPSRGTVE